MEDKTKVTQEQEENPPVIFEDSKTNAQTMTANAVPSTEGSADTPAAGKAKSKKKKLAVLGILVVVVIAVAFAFLHKTKFERVADECVQIAGMIVGDGKSYFTLDTYPDSWESMDEAAAALLAPAQQENTLVAIQYANEELGFNGSLYTRMLETTSLMGRQTEENDQYKVSWTYHPDDGLEATYEKK